MVIAEIKAQQTKILDRLQVVENFQPLAACPVNLLTRIKLYSCEELFYCFGDLGIKLKYFVQAIDLQHPDLMNIFSGQMTQDVPGCFGREGSDLLKLTSYGLNCQFSRYTLGNLKTVIQQHEMWKNISARIDDPVLNQQHVRFISDPKLRSCIRKSKRSQEVYFKIRSLKLWRQSKDFSTLIRNEIRYSEEIQKAEKRYNHFMKLGLSCMADEVKKSLTFIENKSQFDLYLGFNKVSLKQTAFILARIIDLKLHEKPLPAIYISPNKLNDLIDSGDPLRYRPEAYCLHDFSQIPDTVKRVLDQVEAMPELGGRAAFDHYRIVVPSFEYPSKLLSYRTTEGEVVECKNYNEVKKGIDLELLRSGRTVGALLGERDGHYFFLSYWIGDL